MKDKIMLIMSMFIFGTMSIFVKNINISSAEIAFWRASIALIILVIFMLPSGRIKNINIDPKTLVKLLVSGAFMGVEWILLFESYKYTSVAVSTLCYYTAPIAVILASYFIFKEELGLKKIVCFCVATIGLILIVLSNGFGSGNGIKGIVLALMAAALYAVVTLTNKATKSVSGLEKTVFQFLAAMIVILPYILLTDGFQISEVSTKGAVCLLVLGVVHTGIAYILYFGSLPNVTGQQASLFAYIDPMMAIFISAFVLMEKVSIFEWIGGCTILICTLINEIDFKKLKK